MGDSLDLRRIRVYMVEEQEILLETIPSILASKPSVELVGMSGETGSADIADSLSRLHPDVLLMGVKVLQSSTILELKRVRDIFPNIGIVLLYAFYDNAGMRQLREFTRKYSRGCAFLLKCSIDKSSQLVQVIHAVNEGQVVLDSRVMEGIIDAGELTATFMKELTHRELEVVSYMAKGYRNAMIAELLHVDHKTIERHINSIYSKLNLSDEFQHPRVNAIMLYLKATGQLPSDAFAEIGE